MQELFNDKEYCYSQIREAREIFGNRNTTREQFDAMMRALAFGMLYCPEDIRTFFESTLKEATLRQCHYEFNIWTDK